MGPRSLEGGQPRGTSGAAAIMAKRHLFHLCAQSRLHVSGSFFSGAPPMGHGWVIPASFRPRRMSSQVGPSCLAHTRRAIGHTHELDALLICHPIPSRGDFLRLRRVVRAMPRACSCRTSPTGSPSSSMPRIDRIAQQFSASSFVMPPLHPHSWRQPDRLWGGRGPYAPLRARDR